MFEKLAQLDAKLDTRQKYTTIFKIGITPEGQFCVGKNKDTIKGWLKRDAILDAVAEISYDPVCDKDPFFVDVHGRQRLVFSLGPDAWFYQPTLAPFTLKTPDPMNNFVNQTKLEDDPYNMGRTKTIYVDDNNKVAGEIFYYNLFIDIWQEAQNYNSARMPVIIDPGVGNQNGNE
jgi:hypothetical protein